MTDENESGDGFDVTPQEFREDLISDLEETVEQTVEEKMPEVPDVPEDVVTAEETQEIAGATVTDQLEHLAHEDCDTPVCNQLRDEFGFNPGEGEGDSGNDGESNPGESESTGDSSGGDGEGEDVDDEEPGSNGGDGADTPANAAFPDEL